MSGYVLIADGAEARLRARAEQLALDGWEVKAALRPDHARQLLPGAEVLVLGEFAASTVVAQELLRELRAGNVAGANRTMCVLATADTEPQIISALSAGADMTVARVASVTLVGASVSALVRRSDLPGAAETVTVGALEIDPAGRSVKVAGEKVRISARQFDVLALLAEKPGRVYTRDEISRQVWGGPDVRTSRALDTHVTRMAGKFRAAGVEGVVQNVWGQGYKLNNTTQGVEQ